MVWERKQRRRHVFNVPLHQDACSRSAVVRRGLADLSKEYYSAKPSTRILRNSARCRPPYKYPASRGTMYRIPTAGKDWWGADMPVSRGIMYNFDCRSLRILPVPRRRMRRLTARSYMLRRISARGGRPSRRFSGGEGWWSTRNIRMETQWAAGLRFHQHEFAKKFGAIRGSRGPRYASGLRSGPTGRSVRGGGGGGLRTEYSVFRLPTWVAMDRRPR